MRPPLRYVPSPEDRRRFGERIDRGGAFLWEGDPVADAVADALLAHRESLRSSPIDAYFDGTLELSRHPAPVREALERLLSEVEHVPFWVDREQVRRGGEVVLRGGLLSGLVLSVKSLVMGYTSPAGNKPLAFSGRLTEQAGRRMLETGRYVQSLCLPGGLLPRGAGVRASVKVRLMHATVRQSLGRSPKWDAQAWGTPINQLDMAGTALLFSYVFLEGMRQLGARHSQAERDALLHLWRYAGYLMGVREELLCATEAEARTLWELILATQGMPDEDSVRLTHALLDDPERQAKGPEELARARRFTQLTRVLCRYLVGDTYADALKLPRTSWRHAVPALGAILGGAEGVLRRVPGGEALALFAGSSYWERALREGLGGADVRFDPPSMPAH